MHRGTPPQSTTNAAPWPRCRSAVPVLSGPHLVRLLSAPGRRSGWAVLGRRAAVQIPGRRSPSSRRASGAACAGPSGSHRGPGARIPHFSIDFCGRGRLGWGRMDVVLLGARMVLAAVLLAAALGKLSDLAGARRALTDFGVPPGIARVAGPVLPAAELAVAVGLVVPGAARWAALAAAGLLLVFCAGSAARWCVGTGRTVTVSGARIRGRSGSGRSRAVPSWWRSRPSSPSRGGTTPAPARPRGPTASPPARSPRSSPWWC